jgi:TfdA family taurine catabolism dioxygenase TauD/antirestriction factor ArdC-like protein
MSISIFPITTSFAAEIGDIDLRRPLANEDLTAVRKAFAVYAVLVFPAQQLSADQHLAFATNFGPVERTVDSMMGDKLRLPEGISNVANLDANGDIWKKDNRWREFQMMGNRLWHTDSSEPMLACVRRDAATSRPKIPDWFLNFSPPSSQVRGPAENFPFLGTGESIMDVYQIVTDKIVGMLEAGVVPWRKPWSSAGLPRNLVTKKPYRGMTIFSYPRASTSRHFG